MASSPKPLVVRSGVYRKAGESSEQDKGPICTGDAKPCIPEGEYLAVCRAAVRYVNPRFKRDEIALRFTVWDGEHSGTKLVRYYSFARSGSHRSHYYREWVIANNGYAPQRGDRMSLKKFKGKLFRVRVATVKADAYQEQLPQAMYYSKVAAILELLQTNERPN